MEILPTRYRPQNVRIVRNGPTDDVAPRNTLVPSHARDELIDFSPARHEDNKASCELLRVEIVQQTGGLLRHPDCLGGKRNVTIVRGHVTSLEL